MDVVKGVTTTSTGTVAVAPISAGSGGAARQLHSNRTSRVRSTGKAPTRFNGFCLEATSFNWRRGLCADDNRDHRLKPVAAKASTLKRTDCIGWIISLFAIRMCKAPTRFNGFCLAATSFNWWRGWRPISPPPSYQRLVCLMVHLLRHSTTTQPPTTTADESPHPSDPHVKPRLDRNAPVPRPGQPNPVPLTPT